MSNLIRNPDFGLGLEHWETNPSLRYALDKKNCVNVVFTPKTANHDFLSQTIDLEAGSYFFKVEINAPGQFMVDISDVHRGQSVKKIAYKNGVVDYVEFSFTITTPSELSLKLSFVRPKPGDSLDIKYICLHKDGEDSSPYAKKPARSFWGGSVSNRHYFDITEISNHHSIIHPDFKYATAGSCFAQHISRHLKRHGLNCLDLERPPEELSEEEASSFGYNQFSCRYGNIYTTRQLYQLFLESEDRLSHEDSIWCKQGRFYDALRPSVDPVGYSRPEYVKKQRALHLEKIALLWRSFDVFIFTLGLTECWASREYGTVYPTAPGTVAGCFDDRKYEFLNLDYEQVYSDLLLFWSEIKTINSKARLLLTVSPVPLTATATDEHVLVATAYSKSVLRAVAGDFVRNNPDTFYFPSFELINSHPSRAMFYDSNLRTVNNAGVDFVMSRFFAEKSVANSSPAVKKQADNPVAPISPEFEVYCDEELLDRFDKN